MIHCRKGGAARALPVATLAHKMGRRCFVMLALLAQVKETAAATITTFGNNYRNCEVFIDSDGDLTRDASEPFGNE